MGANEVENYSSAQKNKNNANIDINNIWSNYKFKKFIEYKNIHHFGIFINYSTKSNSNIIQERSDLIGNGFLTNYNFSLPKVKIMNSMFFTYDRNEAKRGFVRTIKNVTMYTNQAFVKYSNIIDSLTYNFKIGRDFLVEGYGSSKIFFSDFSRPFDQVTFNASFKNFRSKISIISLDKINEFRRYLYMHTFKYKFEKLDISIGEAIISSGIDNSVDIKLLNPFSFWSWENLGSTDRGYNAFLYTGFSLLAQKSLRLYGEILLDDINFHKSNSFFLNRYAYLFGIKKRFVPI